MPPIAEVTSTDTIKFPAEIAERLGLKDRFYVWAEGDSLHLKRIAPADVVGIVRDAPQGEPMSLEEINEIVHDVRRSGNE